MSTKKSVHLLLFSLTLIQNSTMPCSECDSDGIHGASYGWIALQNKHHALERTRIIRWLNLQNQPGILVAIFNAHFGTRATNFAVESLPRLFGKYSIHCIPEEALRNSFMDITRSLEDAQEESGTTILAMFANRDQDGKPVITIANAGTSRAIATSKSGRVIFKTTAYRPDILPENRTMLPNTSALHRSTPYQSTVEQYPEIAHGLTLGNYRLKKAQRGMNQRSLTPATNIYKKKLLSPAFVILACNSLWKVMNSDDVAQITGLHMHIKGKERLAKVQELDQALALQERRYHRKFSPDIDPFNQCHLTAAALVEEALERKCDDPLSILVFYMLPHRQFTIPSIASTLPTLGGTEQLSPSHTSTPLDTTQQEQTDPLPPIMPRITPPPLSPPIVSSAALQHRPPVTPPEQMTKELRGILRHQSMRESHRSPLETLPKVVRKNQSTQLITRFTPETT